MGRVQTTAFAIVNAFNGDEQAGAVGDFGRKGDAVSDPGVAAPACGSHSGLAVGWPVAVGVFRDDVGEGDGFSQAGAVACPMVAWQSRWDMGRISARAARQSFGD